jgi:histidyl-tRNA synthetase
MGFKAIYGTRDLLPEGAARWQELEEKVRKMMKLYDYQEIRTPIFEATELFARSIGRDTDIVSKEMYTFQDQGKRSLTLRPEATASVVRAYLEHNLGRFSPFVKLYYIGPMFRQERPQKGRLRQFHQFGAEAIGSLDPLVDVEMVQLSVNILNDLGLDDFNLHLNSIGCKKCRSGHRDIFLDFVRKRSGEICSDCQIRLNRNPLRMFDCKNEECIEILKEAPMIKDHLCDECKNHFNKVKRHVDDLGIRYLEDGRLVRGLDYYTKTVYELKSPLLGAQDTLCGGGRYDLLVEELGGENTPAIGFSAGIERILLVLESKKKLASTDKRIDYFIAALGNEAKEIAFKLLEHLRSENKICEMDYLNRSLKSQMKEANRQGAKLVLIIGENEIKNKKATQRNMDTAQEDEVDISEFMKPKKQDFYLPF